MSPRQRLPSRCGGWRVPASWTGASTPEDHRKFRIYLTESGRRTARQLSQITDQMRGVFTKNFSPEEQMLFKRFLLQVRENLLESDDKNRSLSQEKAPDEKIPF